MAVMNKRSTLAFGGASVFLVGVVMLMDGQDAPAPSTVSLAAYPATEQAFLSQGSSTRLFLNKLRPQYWTPTQERDFLSPHDVRDIIQKWIAAAQARDVDAVVSLYDPKVGRLLGTVDSDSSPRRSSRALIRDYFNHFLGDNEKVVPIFPRFNERDVQFIDDTTAVYSGYYTFELTPIGGRTKIANAKFTYIVHRTKENGVQLVLHNSGLTPAGVVIEDGPAPEDESLSLSDVQKIMQDWIAAAKARDVDAIVDLYDEKVGRLLGTVDSDSSPRRTSRALIRDYFNHFLGDNEKVLPLFPRFTERDVQFIDDKTAVYSGYYTFELTPIGGLTKIANAKFTYIVHRTKEAGVQLVLHNSGLTPAGVVMK
jgi:hypothetical protein